MLSPKEVKALSEQEEKQLEAAEAYIDGQVQSEYDAEPQQREYSIDRAKLSKAIGGLTIKVREAIVDRYGKGGWKVELNADAIILRMPKRGGRRSKADKAASEPQSNENAAAEAVAAEAD